MVIFAIATNPRIEDEAIGQQEEQYFEDQEPNSTGMPPFFDHISPMFYKVIIFCFNILHAINL